MFEAVVEDDDDGRAETVHTEQLRASSSNKTLRQGPHDGKSCVATEDAAPDVLPTGQHETGNTKAPRDVLTSQSIRTCLRREVPTDQAAHSQACPDETSRVETTPQHWRGLQPGSRCGPRSTITASLWPSPRADHEWGSDVTSQSDCHSSGANDFHAQRAVRGEWCWSSSQRTMRST